MTCYVAMTPHFIRLTFVFLLLISIQYVFLIHQVIVHIITTAKPLMYLKPVNTCCSPPSDLAFFQPHIKSDIFATVSTSSLATDEGKNAAATKLQTDYYFRKRISIRLWGGQSSLQMAC